MRLKDWLRTNRHLFCERDLRFLIKNLFSTTLPYAFIDNFVVNREKINYLDRLKELYSQGIPLPYLLGKEEFLGLEFKVNKKVLIPRPETELIVEAALKYACNRKRTSILDLACGCANITVGIKKFLGDRALLFSSDISLPALMVAQTNLELHDVESNIINTNLFSGFQYNAFDLVVTNPPYVSPDLIVGTLEYEPRIALEAKNEGLYYIEKILRQAPLYVRRQGHLIIEMGHRHKQAVESIVEQSEFYEMEEWIKDFSGFWRGVVLKVKTKRK